MPPVGRTCSECGAPLSSRSVRSTTCSDKCRTARSRRVRRQNREVEDFQERNNAGANEIAAIVRREAPDVVTRVMKAELQPIVRQALTEDVLRSINSLVGLTPRAVAALTEDLESEDRTIRQRAYTLLIKYTVGHPALVKQEDTDDNRQLVVNFNLPRPDAPSQVNEEENLAVELRACDMCGEDKSPDEFASGSSRCLACFDEWKKRVMEQVGA
jgi:hypothetical protein